MWIRKRTYDDMIEKINTLETLLDCETRNVNSLLQQSFDYAKELQELKSKPKRTTKRTKKEDK